MTIRRASISSGDIRYRRAGKGAPVVLLHTLRTQLEYFDRLIAALDPSRFEVIARAARARRVQRAAGGLHGELLHRQGGGGARPMRLPWGDHRR